MDGRPLSRRAIPVAVRGLTTTTTGFLPRSPALDVTRIPCRRNQTSTSWDGSDPFEPRTPASQPSPPLTVRALVPASDVGMCIGSRGSTIASVREASGAKALFKELVTGADERVLVVSGSVQNCAEAIKLFASMRAENANAEKVAFKLLVPQAHGHIIGNGAHVGDVSNADVYVEQDVLPNSTDIAVNLLGRPDE
ncbi:Poly(rC)-binding protein 3, partial [Irineochytrium annulatum]